MDIKLPKWMIMELSKDSDHSVQYVIKEVLKEYLSNDELSKVIRKRVRGREGKGV